MNIDEWIAEHTRCIINLSLIIDGIGKEPLQSLTLGEEDSCALGRWIHGEGRRFEVLLRYRDLVKKHARFHVVAARVLKKVESNNLAGARTAFDHTLAGTSAALLRAIVDLKPDAIGNYCPEPGRGHKNEQRKPASHR